MYWFNYAAAVVIFAMMIPNFIYAKKQAGQQQTLYGNKILEILEKIGRIGCIFCMLCNFPDWQEWFWFDHGRTVFIFVNAGLVALYYIFWIICWKRRGKLRALSLSIIPTVIFVFSGIVLSYIPLIVVSVLFGATHIYLSIKREKFLS